MRITISTLSRCKMKKMLKLTASALCLLIMLGGCESVQSRKIVLQEHCVDKPVVQNSLVNPPVSLELEELEQAINRLTKTK